jgi:hypothetical protein
MPGVRFCVPHVPLLYAGTCRTKQVRMCYELHLPGRPPIITEHKQAGALLRHEGSLWVLYAQDYDSHSDEMANELARLFELPALLPPAAEGEGEGEAANTGKAVAAGAAGLLDSGKLQKEVASLLYTVLTEMKGGGAVPEAMLRRKGYEPLPADVEPWQLTFGAQAGQAWQAADVAAGLSAPDGPAGGEDVQQSQLQAPLTPPQTSKTQQVRAAPTAALLERKRRNAEVQRAMIEGGSAVALDIMKVDAGRRGAAVPQVLPEQLDEQQQKAVQRLAEANASKAAALQAAQQGGWLPLLGVLPVAEPRAGGGGGGGGGGGVGGVWGGAAGSAGPRAGGPSGAWHADAAPNEAASWLQATIPGAVLSKAGPLPQGKCCPGG